MADFTTRGYSMICASSEAERHEYYKFVGKSGRIWLVAEVSYAGEHVYVSGDENSQGFGGRTLRFNLVNGEGLDLKGPWHSNPEALFQDTGVDVRGRHRTFCVIAKYREFNGDKCTFKDVLYQDREPVLGYFDRPDVKKLAKNFAIELGHSVYVYKETKGGSSNFSVDPADKFIPANKKDW